LTKERHKQSSHELAAPPNPGIAVVWLERGRQPHLF